jgi:EAL domain-containing protein (putative c-di-GMP-specific phosphodiesterase class I)
LEDPLTFAAAALVDAEVTPATLASRLDIRPSLPRILNSLRKHLGMDVAFISELLDGQRIFRYVDTNEPDSPVETGFYEPAEDSYCLRVVDGRLPELMTDACLNAEALTLAATRALPVGAHMSVPIRLANGAVYGTFCCFSHAPNPTLTDRDLSVMRVFAEMVGEQIQEEMDARDARLAIEHRIDLVLKSDLLEMVFQPIVEVASHRVVAFEALARFRTEPYRPPDVWFAEAAIVGRAVELETKAIRMALAALDQVPPQVYLTVNLSPQTIVQGPLAEVLRGFPLDRVVLEVTEHQAIESYEDIAAAILPLQREGLRIAIDDAGAGYASFRHILNLHPNIVKLDISLTRAIDTDRSRRALAAALCGFATETGCRIVAEGIETEAELQVIRALGVGKAQGYHLGRPMALKAAQALVGSA